SGDQLLFTDTAKIHGSYSAGTLTLTAIAAQTPSEADYEAALATVKFNNTSDTPDVTDRSIQFTVTDPSSATSTAASITLHVAATNDTPTISVVQGASTTFTEIDGPDTAANDVTLLSSANIVDLDGTNPQSVAVTITNVQSGDQLLFTDTAKIHGSYSAGTLTLTAIAAQTPSEADYEAALATVKFNNTSDTPDVTDRSIQFTVTDPSSATSTAASITLHVAATNDTPTISVVQGASTTFTEIDGPDTAANDVTLLSSANIVDLDGTNPQSVAVTITNVQSGDQLLFTDTAKIHGSYSAGTLTLTAIAAQTPSEADYEAALATVKFNNTSDTPDVTDRSIQFTVTDPSSATSTAASITLHVAATNDTPTISVVQGASTTFTEIDGPDTAANDVTLLSSANIVDLDGTNPQSVAVTITNVQSGDQLLFTDTAKIHGSYSAGTLTLTAIAAQTPSEADYEAALATVKFNN